jgi:hypothetical protein
MAKAHAEKGKQLEIVTTNEPGTGAEIFNVLEAAKINVKASCIWESGDGQAHFLLVPEDLPRARKLLRKAKFKPYTKPVILIDLSNRPGAFAQVLKKVAEAGVQCKISYAAAATKKSALAVLTTSSDAKAVRAINS